MDAVRFNRQWRKKILGANWVWGFCERKVNAVSAATNSINQPLMSPKRFGFGCPNVFHNNPKIHKETFFRMRRIVLFFAVSKKKKHITDRIFRLASKFVVSRCITQLIQRRLSSQSCDQRQPTITFWQHHKFYNVTVFISVSANQPVECSRNWHNDHRYRYTDMCAVACKLINCNCTVSQALMDPCQCGKHYLNDIKNKLWRPPKEFLIFVLLVCFICSVPSKPVADVLAINNRGTDNVSETR